MYTVPHLQYESPDEECSRSSCVHKPRLCVLGAGVVGTDMNGHLKNKRKKRKKKKRMIPPSPGHQTDNAPCRIDLLRGGAASACQVSLSLPPKQPISSEVLSPGLGAEIRNFQPKEPSTGSCDTKQLRESKHGSGSHTCRSVLKKRLISRQQSRWSVRFLPWGSLARKSRPRRGCQHCVSSCYFTTPPIKRRLPVA